MVGNFATSGSAGYNTDVVGSRVVAQVIDWVAILVVTVVLGLFLISSGARPSESTFTVVAGISAYLYNAGLEATWDGQTVGKRVASIQAQDRRGESLSVGQACIRNIPAIVSPGLFLYLVALLSIAMDDKKRRVFDHAAGTVVVQRF